MSKTTDGIKNKTVNEAWSSYLEMVMQGVTNSVQISEARLAFYAGYFDSLNHCKELGGIDMSEQEAISILERLYQECKSFSVQHVKDSKNG